MGDAEGRERLHIGVCLRREDVRGARSLDRDECRAERAIVERDVLAEMRENVRAVLRDVCGVHDDHVLVVADPIDDDVVDDRPALVGEEPVPRLAHRKAGDVTRDEAVEHGAGGTTLEEELAHVREIEEAGPAAYRAMLGNDALVLNWHLVPRERHDLRAELLVLLEQRRAPQRWSFGRHHAASPAAASARSRISR